MKKIIIIGLVALSACVYPYEIEGVKEIASMLVVEGDIIANGITEVRLSRSFALLGEGYPPEEGALVYIEDDRQGRYPAIEVDPGRYEAQTRNLDLGLRYRLYIELASKKVYVSDYVPVLVSPPIDSVTYTVNVGNSALDIHVSTHDPTGASRYYKWEYAENWEIHVALFSEYVFDPSSQAFLHRPYEENIYYCWNTGASSAILLANSSRLEEDVVTRAPILTIEEQDTRASLLYCIQLTQKVLSQEGYVYWECLRKNSEDMGGIFSNQPSELRGNVYAMDQAEEIVLGFISATAVSYSERTFIPVNLLNRREPTCEIGTPPPLGGFDNIDFHKAGWIPMGQSLWAQPGCADCRVYGTKNKPSWWPNDHF
jgi:hypothetical protein